MSSFCCCFFHTFIQEGDLVKTHTVVAISLLPRLQLLLVGVVCVGAYTCAMCSELSQQ
jgi:hypothetical protein